MIPDSLQHQPELVPSESEKNEIPVRRFAPESAIPRVGTGPELVDKYNKHDKYNIIRPRETPAGKFVSKQIVLPKTSYRGRVPDIYL